MPTYFVRFPDGTFRPLAQPMLAADPERFRSHSAETNETVLIADLSDEQRQAAERNGAKVYEDIQFYPTPLPGNPLDPFLTPNYAYWETASAAPAALALMTPAAAAPWQTKTLTDVLDHIGAPRAWRKARGQGVTIGIVDTGVSSVMSEFPPQKRSPFSKSFAYSQAPGSTWSAMARCAPALPQPRMPAGVDITAWHPMPRSWLLGRTCWQPTSTNFTTGSWPGSGPGSLPGPS
jgi:hypothetical protein